MHYFLGSRMLFLFTPASVTGFQTTVALGHGSLFPPADASGLEQPMSGNLSQVVVTGVGHWRGEALALVERVD